MGLVLLDLTPPSWLPPPIPLDPDRVPPPRPDDAGRDADREDDEGGAEEPHTSVHSPRVRNP